MNEDIKAQLRENTAVGEQVINALQLFIDNDRHLLEVDANERSLTHRIGMYLQDQFPDYDVDCEYNRNIHIPKRVHPIEYHPDAQNKEKLVLPDIIVHKRGNNDHNLLIIEFKKTTFVPDCTYIPDRDKLDMCMRDLMYKHALFVELETKRLEQPGCEIKSVSWVF